MYNVLPHSLFFETDVFLFRQGTHFRLYEKFGAHSLTVEGQQGVYFSVWAPFAKNVSVIGDFNNWQNGQHNLLPRWDRSGIWEGFIAGLNWGSSYKYAIHTKDNQLLEKGDPFALSWEQNTLAASLISTTYFEWTDDKWMQTRASRNSLTAPISVYEMHLASWCRDPLQPHRFLNYREIAEKLVPYLLKMGFTHVELMPVMEYPYDPSWGYQVTGFFAATSRFGAPQDLMFLINELHRNNIGVLLDWVPSHFPGDANGLHRFDGSFLYEHEDPRKGFHPEWKSYIFNYGRPEVKSFLISNALFWLDRYHADGLRVDAVTSMLQLDYARKEGEWEPNAEGGSVNLEAKVFLQDLNKAVYKSFPDTVTIAEESSDFPMLTKPVAVGGVGFGMKWMMGWMHDTLKFFSQNREGRIDDYHKLTFASAYAFNENYMMPLSHDEVVHGKASLIYKMDGDEWQKFANLRTLFVYMFTQPGAKLIFMGDEFAQTSEWNFRKALDWHLLEHRLHRGIQLIVRKLNELYRTEKALYELNFEREGMHWIQADDRQQGVYIYLRKGKKQQDTLLVALNTQAQIRQYEAQLPLSATWTVLLNSDDAELGGSGVEVTVSAVEKNTKENKNLVLKLPPLAGVLLKVKQIITEKATPTSAKKISLKK